MGKYYGNVDQLQFEYKNQDRLLIHGWYALIPEEPGKLVIYGDGEEIPVLIQEGIERIDVTTSQKELEAVLNPGYCVRIPEIAETMKKYHSLELYLEYAQEKKLLWKRECDELRIEYESRKICYHTDVVAFLTRKMLKIGGWVIHPTHRGEIQVTIEGMDAKASCEVKKVKRHDVERELHLDGTEEKAGFEILIKSSKFPNQLKLHFKLDELTLIETIDLEALKKDASISYQLRENLKKNVMKENFSYLKEKGFRQFARHMDLKINAYMGDYQKWYRGHKVTKREADRQQKCCFPYMPMISIVIPLYNTPIPFLKALIDSVVNQTYGNWQLCLADGSNSRAVQSFLQKKYKNETRISYQKLLENKGISENTNCALRMAQGDYVMFCDHDDLLTIDALWEIVWHINKYNQPEALYTDEDKIDMDGQYYFDPNFKPDYNEYWLRGNNYICHIFAVKKELLERVGELRSEYDGAQDYDFILRCCEEADQVVHIPKVLYHWRCHAGSTAENPESKAYAYDAGRRAVEEHYERMGMKAVIELGENVGWYRAYNKIYRVAKISIIILNRDHIYKLRNCLSSIDEKTFYQNYEIIVVDNHSQSDQTFYEYERLKEEYPRLRVLINEEIKGIPALYNYGAEQAEGAYYVFLNRNTEIMTSEWIEEMLGICQQFDVGAVGAKLYYPNHTIRHAGLILGMKGIAGRIFHENPDYEEGYRCKAVNVQQLSAVTAECMMVKKNVFKEVKGFDSAFMKNYYDADLCLRIQQVNQKVVFTPFSALCWQGKRDGVYSGEKIIDDYGEEELFRKRWQRILKKGDPYYNPNLSLDSLDCKIGDLERKERKIWLEKSTK